MSDLKKNWAGNIEYQATAVYAPRSISELQELVRQSSRLRVLGSRHSFNHIADTTAVHISLGNLPPKIDISVAEQTVTVHGNIKYGDLCLVLDAEGYALHNLASLPHISVAGAIATATHGSGINNGNLATAVTALTIIDAEGEIRTLSRQSVGDDFDGMVVHLGSLGVIVEVTLSIQPTFNMRQFVYKDLSFERVLANFDDAMSASYSVSLFTDWQGDTVNQLWLKERVDGEVAPPAQSLLGGQLAKRPYHPLAEVSAESCTAQMGEVGSWFERLPHFKMEFTPSFGDELQSEYFVSIEHAVPALTALNKISAQVGEQLFISEIRMVAADNFWLSPCYQQTCVAFHFTWKPNWQEVRKILPLIERALIPFYVRPHWGKLFMLSPQIIRASYPKMVDFKSLTTQFDPSGKFRNRFINSYIS